MHSWLIFLILAVGAAISAASSSHHYRHGDTALGRTTLLGTTLLGIPAVVVFILILKDGARSASTVELLGFAIYTLIVSIFVGTQLKRRPSTQPR